MEKIVILHKQVYTTDYQVTCDLSVCDLSVDELDEGDVLVSGWGDDDNDLNDDLLKQWSDMLERWDGRDKWDPKGDKPRSKQLCKLVRKV